MSIDTEHAKSSPFRWFDALVSFDRKPDTRAMGWLPCDCTGDLLTPDGTAPDRDKCLALGRRAVANAAGLVVLDIERWPVDIRTTTVSDVARSIARLRQAVEWVREGLAGATIPVGVYAMCPHRDFGAPTGGDAAALAEWRIANRVMGELAEVLDCVCPSLYAFGNDIEQWRVYAVANMEEAAKYGKPVCPFVWWRMHPSNEAWPPGGFLGAEYVAAMVDTVREHADGVVVWDWAGFSDRIDDVDGKAVRVQRRGFDATWPHWRALVERVKEAGAA